MWWYYLRYLYSNKVRIEYVMKNLKSLLKSLRFSFWWLFRLFGLNFYFQVMQNSLCKILKCIIACASDAIMYFSVKAIYYMLSIHHFYRSLHLLWEQTIYWFCNISYVESYNITHRWIRRYSKIISKLLDYVLMGGKNV